MSENIPRELVILWTDRDRDVALNMVFMYLANATKKKWWDTVTLIVWGPSAQLAGTDEEIRSGITQLRAAGVQVLACRTCADLYGVTTDLERLGIEVIFMGEPLTRFLKSPSHQVLTF